MKTLIGRTSFMQPGFSSCLGLAAAVLLGSAAPRVDAADGVPPALLTCAGVKKNSERLACYDQTIERVL